MRLAPTEGFRILKATISLGSSKAIDALKRAANFIGAERRSVEVVVERREAPGYQECLR
jgi:hypothetical protein